MDTEKEKHTIGHLFDRIAPSYDRLNHLFSMGIDRAWRRRALRALPSECSPVLDVAAGTADFSILLAKKGSRVIGIDLSEAMLAIGRKKVQEAGLVNQVSLNQCDVTCMPFADEQFAAITCAFGVRNFAQRRAALSEMHRVLQEGGRVVILEFSWPKSKPVRLIYSWYFTRFMPRVAGLLSGNPKAYAYLPESVRHFPGGDAFAQELRDTGFAHTAVQPLTLGICTLYTGEKERRKNV